MVPSYAYLQMSCRILMPKPGLQFMVRFQPSLLVHIFYPKSNSTYTAGHSNRDGTGNFEKDARWWIKSVGGDDILTADDELHRRMRRLQGPAFSTKALEAQSPIMEKYTSLLIEQLQRLVTDSSGSTVVDMNLWYNLTTFDLISDLAFGEPFHCLRDGHWHWWITGIFGMFHAATYIRAARRFPMPIFYALLVLIVPRKLLKTREDQHKFAAERVKQRMQQTTDRPDFSTSES